MHEDRLIAWLAARAVAPAGEGRGIGDDCCCWRPGGMTCLSVDSVVEGRHFTAATAPEAVGRKAAAAAVSDLAAMGASPRGAVVALHCPGRWDAERVMAGAAGELARLGCPLLGGNTSGAGELSLATTVWGEAVPGGRLVGRDGGRPGDILAVTGALGGSLASGRHLRPEPRLAEGQWLARQAAVHALMDISDGIASDAARLAAASCCAVEVETLRLPVHADAAGAADPIRAAACDGEDYELLLAVDASAWEGLRARWPFALALTAIGRLVPGAGLHLRDAAGGLLPWTGFEHRG